MNRFAIALSIISIFSLLVASGCTQPPAGGGQGGAGTTSSPPSAALNESVGLGSDIDQLSGVQADLPETGLDDISSGVDSALGLV